MGNGSFFDRLFTTRTVQEVLDDASSGYISVFPCRDARFKLNLPFQSLVSELSEEPEIIGELLADGNVLRLQEYYHSVTNHKAC